MATKCVHKHHHLHLHTRAFSRFRALPQHHKSRANCNLLRALQYRSFSDSAATAPETNSTSTAASGTQEAELQTESIYEYEKNLQAETSADAKVIFELIFAEISQRMGGDENMVFPKDIMWLCGAPGSGKGAMRYFQRCLSLSLHSCARRDNVF